MNPGPNAPALRGLVHDLLGTRDGTTHVFRSTSGLFHRYDLGGEHPLAGRIRYAAGPVRDDLGFGDPTP